MGIKPQPLTEFYRSLRSRQVTTDDLGYFVGKSGGAVRRVIGSFRKKPDWWPQFIALLTPREAELLAQVEQCNTWNVERISKRRKWPQVVRMPARERINFNP